MTHHVFIDGAAGTTGLEIRERLAGRDEFELIVLDDERRKDVEARREALHEADVAILCLPDDAAREAVKLAEGSNTRIIDASSAHRVSDGWTYGFPELIGHEQIANAQFVSNPGCYPSGFLALVRPLTWAGWISELWPYTVNAVSGVSGGGNALVKRFQDAPELAFRAYGTNLDHKHLPEMQAYAGLTYPPVFSPSVVPAYRGMIVDVPVPQEALSTPARSFIIDELQRYYYNSPVVTVSEEAPEELVLDSNAAPWDGMTLYVCTDEAFSQVRLIARLDNLGKGASGAAIQNLNIMCGIEETTGLKL